MSNMFPTWQVAKFSTASDIGVLDYEPAGLVPVEDNEAAAFSGGLYKWDGPNKAFQMQPRWWINQQIYDGETGMTEPQALAAPAHTIMSLLDYIPANNYDIYYVALFFRVNMTGRFTDDTQPMDFMDDNWGGETDYAGDPSTWSSMPVRLNVFNADESFTALTVPYDDGTGLHPKAFSNLLGTSGVDFDPAGGSGEEYGTEGFRIHVGQLEEPEESVAASSLNLALQLVPDAVDFHPNFEIIGVQLNEVLLGRDHNGNTAEFWQDFYKTLEVVN